MKVYLKKEQKNKHQKTEALLLAIALFVVTASLILKTKGEHNIVLPGGKTISGHLCLFYRATGYPDLGCGLTRSFISTAHFNLDQAFLFHLLGPLLFAAFLLAIPYLLYRVLGGRNKIAVDWTKKQMHLLATVALATVLGAWIIKLYFRLY